ncbi:hypothetical protein HDF16_005696 [Granulicella aggregans]|uniref:Uncharacterized protein n=1 Tax=Granulicella aggregans TaxID=474949 RepID=A0A7W7ZJ94_9BACT|nr:hypothetical protein [Granulicella aggregans]
MLSVQSVISIYATPNLAADAIRLLQKVGTCVERISIAGSHEPTVAEVKQPELTRYSSEQGAAWGGPWALLHHSAIFKLPDFGPVRLAGPLIFWMKAIQARGIAFPGVTTFGAGLVSIGVPIQTALTCEHALRAHQFPLIVHGQSEIVFAARDAMAAALPASLMVHGNAPCN